MACASSLTCAPFSVHFIVQSGPPSSASSPTDKLKMVEEAKRKKIAKKPAMVHAENGEKGNKENMTNEQ